MPTSNGNIITLAGSITRIILDFDSTHTFFLFGYLFHNVFCIVIHITLNVKTGMDESNRQRCSLNTDDIDVFTTILLHAKSTCL